MDLIALVLILVLIGVAVWFIISLAQKPPLNLPPWWAQVIQLFALVVLIFFLLRRLGLGIPNVM